MLALISVLILVPPDTEGAETFPLLNPPEGLLPPLRLLEEELPPRLPEEELPPSPLEEELLLPPLRPLEEELPPRPEELPPEDEKPPVLLPVREG